MRRAESENNALKDEFLSVYEMYSDSLFRRGFFKLSSRDLAKDVLQDTFMKTWQYIKKGGTINDMKSFIYRTHNNLIIDEYRKKKPESLDLLHDDKGIDFGENNLEALYNKIDGEKALLLLNKLPTEYRDVIFMKYVEELTIQEIASLTNESPNNISVRLHRGLEKARKLYNDHE